jgi:peptidoglycan/LPS O-acetylase OafA/YrhL
MMLVKSNISFVLPDVDRDNNFNFLRLFFALSVAFGHALLSEYDYPLRALFNGHVAVCGFFIISGFLITKSYQESKSVKEYLIKRCRRLLPAYWLVVLLCAAGLSVFSSLPPEEYFTSPLLFRHIAASLVFMNFLQPSLPGVFMSEITGGGGGDKRISEVNGSLWTIRIEVLFYMLIPLIAFALSRLKTRKRINIALAAAYLFGFLYSNLWTFIAENTSSPLLYGVKESSDYIAYFATGIFCLINLDRVKKHVNLFILPAFIIVILEYMFTFNTVLELFFPAGLGIVIVFTAFGFPCLRSIGKTGDYSYGIYIFHAPLIKILLDLGYYGLNEYVAVFLGISASFSSAYMSWHFVEKKALASFNRGSRPSLKLKAG